MADYYAGSSALVKRHVYEPGSDWFQTLVEPPAGNLIVTARLSMVEVYSALNRRLRETHLNIADYIQIADDFTAVCATEYQLVELTIAIVERARLLLEHHALRAYDAIQLASALTSSDTLQTAGLSPLIFVAADNDLLTAAQAEGLVTDNPNDHA